MGLRGTTPKPSAVRIREGMRGHRPLAKEPKHAAGIPQKPKHISAAAQPIWNEMIDAMDPRMLSHADRRALWQLAEDEAILAEAYSGFWKMAKALKTKAKAEGKELPAGEIASLLSMQNGRSAMRTIRDIAGRVIVERREFGLTPSSRTRISTSDPFAADSLELKLCG